MANAVTVNVNAPQLNKRRHRTCTWRTRDVLQAGRRHQLDSLELQQKEPVADERGGSQQNTGMAT